MAAKYLTMKSHTLSFGIVSNKKSALLKKQQGYKRCEKNEKYWLYQAWQGNEEICMFSN